MVRRTVTDRGKINSLESAENSEKSTVKGKNESNWAKEGEGGGSIKTV